MPDYSKGKIYAIKSYECDDIYIGSTINRLSDRLWGHRSSYNRFINGDDNVVISSFEILQFDDAFIELIEEYPCKNKDQLKRREGEIITKTINCLNKNIAGRTQDEYQKSDKYINYINSEKRKKEKLEWQRKNRKNNI